MVAQALLQSCHFLDCVDETEDSKGGNSCKAKSSFSQNTCELLEKPQNYLRRIFFFGAGKTKIL